MKKDRIRYITEIKNVGELRQVRREVDLELWYTEERLAGDVAETFSPDNLLSIIAPPGSVADRIVGSLGTGMATIRGVINGIQMFRGR